MRDIIETVVFNGLWIVGLALLLAALSYYYDRAQRSQLPLRHMLGTGAFAPLAWTAFVFICGGLAGTSAQLWETVLWLLFTLYALLSAAGHWRAYASGVSQR